MESLLFISDISGFTKFVQTTEVEHSEHVISELLEVLINANTQSLQLAEIEGDALFFFKENQIPSQEKLLAQVESMYTAFYSHLKMMETNRICPCNACVSAQKLRLKIIAHCGDFQFLKVQESRKPFGEAVIQAHRLLKNSVESDNYFLISKELSDSIGLPEQYESTLYQFRHGNDSYDGKRMEYRYAEIDVTQLKLHNFAAPLLFATERQPNFTKEVRLEVSAYEVYELLTNYKYRHKWVEGVDQFKFKENEVTRVGTEHICVINGKYFNFVTVIKEAPIEHLVYGELTFSPPPIDRLYQFYTMIPTGEHSCSLKVELYWYTRTPKHKLMLLLGGGKQLIKGVENSIDNLAKLLNNQNETVLG